MIGVYQTPTHTLINTLKHINTLDECVYVVCMFGWVWVYEFVLSISCVDECVYQQTHTHTHSTLTLTNKHQLTNISTHKQIHIKPYQHISSIQTYTHHMWL